MPLLGVPKPKRLTHKEPHYINTMWFHLCYFLLLSPLANASSSHTSLQRGPAIKYAKHNDLSNKITFLIGENGSEKSTLLE